MKTLNLKIATRLLKSNLRSKWFIIEVEELFIFSNILLYLIYSAVKENDKLKKKH